jgi:hypothetical protein
VNSGFPTIETVGGGGVSPCLDVTEARGVEMVGEASLYGYGKLADLKKTSGLK